MTAQNPNATQPGNRPPGIPGNARFASAGLAVGIIFIVINAVAAYAVFTNDSDNYFHATDKVFFALIILVPVSMFLLNTGKLIFIKLYRKLALAVSAIYALMIVLDLTQLWLYGTDRASFDIGGVILLLLLSPLQFLMWRDLRHSRWLDPTSLPEEWEIAAIHDPTSINYRAPKGGKK